MQTKKHVAFRLRKSLIDDLKTLAEKRGDSITSLLEEAIIMLLNRYKSVKEQS